MDYLYRHQYDRVKTWGKLYEAALGLLYLHQAHRVVHGDLKCNNILVGDDDKAKIADFGLSFVFDASAPDESSDQEVGAASWKAPEVIDKRMRGTFASDVYSFGMCIIEAIIKGNPLWGTMGDAGIKHWVVDDKKLHKRPDEMNDEQWRLIENMCANDPSERPHMDNVVNILDNIARMDECQRRRLEGREETQK